MRKALLFIAIAMALGIAGEAFAGSDEARGNAPRTTWLDEGAIKSKLSRLRLFGAQDRDRRRGHR